MDADAGHADGEASTPSRRRVLSGLAGACAALLAGCTEDVGEELPPNIAYPVSRYRPELPVEERLAVMAERVEAAADADVEDLETFAAALEGYALELHSVEQRRDVLVVEYENLDPYGEGNVHDVGLIAGAYAAFVEGGFDGAAAEVTILDAAPATYGVAEVETRWATGYNDGQLTAEEYAELVAGTVESKRHEPDVEVDPGE